MTPAPFDRLRAALLTALAYALAAWPALQLATGPGSPAPIYPSAGIALVSVLLYGRRMLPGVWLGALVVEAVLFASAPLPGALRFVVPAVIGLGAAAQAAVGAWLVARADPALPALTEPGEVARFFAFGGALACTLSASVGVGTLALAGIVPPASIARTWLTWWTGDTLGVLIAAPIALALLAPPAALWRPRRRSVALPLAVVTLLAALAIVQARRWDEERAQAVLERDAASASGAVARQLQIPLHALQAMHGLFVASEDVSAGEFRLAGDPWLATPDAPRALGWAEQVGADQLAAFQLLARGEDDPHYTLFDRSAATGERTAPRGEAWAVRFVEPAATRRDWLGLNLLSAPPARRAIERSLRSHAPSATEGIRLGAEDGAVGVVIFRAVDRGMRAASTAIPGNELRGALFVQLRVEDALRAGRAALPGSLQACLVDATPGAPLQRLAGPPGCERRRDAAFSRTSDIDFAQRSWRLVVASRPGAPIATQDAQGTWLFAVVALLAAGTFGALLLTMTGRARRIESAVDERTAALQREIAERARTEAALSDSQQRLRSILNHVPIGVLYADLDGAIRDCNPPFCELLGRDAAQLAGLHVADFTHPADRNGELGQLGRLTRGEVDAVQRQQRLVRRDGSIVSVRTLYSLLRDEQGAPHRLVGVVEDITEHLALRRAEAAREAAEAANQAKTDFLSRMSHELRTPLNAMLGFAQLLELDRRPAAAGSQRDWAGQIQTAGWHLLEMINDILDLSRIEAGTLKLEAQETALAPLLDAATALVERAAQARRIRIERMPASHPIEIHADPTRVKQVLTNLLSNAVKYNVEGGSICVASRVDARGAVEISVSDTGLGMSGEQLAALFQPFNRLGRERSAPEGTGIGLVISRRLAELMGGALAVRSAVGEGSTFVLTLPLASGRPLPRENGLPAEAPAAAYRQRVVHYVEDNETNGIVMEGILAQRPQVRLRVSVTGLEALAAIRATPPSLILLDMHLPDIDGLQLLRLLKDDPQTAAIPVVAVSADAVASRIQAALDAGAEHYLTKPVNVAELLRLLDGLLEERETVFG